MNHSYFVVGDHQFHQGYTLVLLKEHVREPFDLPPYVQREHFREVMRAAEAINNTFQPWKMNFSCYGNAEPHVHWHIVPRYENDPHAGKDPWQDVARFSERTITADQAREIAARIRRNSPDPASVPPRGLLRLPAMPARTAQATRITPLVRKDQHNARAAAPRSTVVPCTGDDGRAHPC